MIGRRVNTLREDRRLGARYEELAVNFVALAKLAGARPCFEKLDSPDRPQASSARERCRAVEGRSRARSACVRGPSPVHGFFFARWSSWTPKPLRGVKSAGRSVDHASFR